MGMLKLWPEGAKAAPPPQGGGVACGAGSSAGALPLVPLRLGGVQTGESIQRALRLPKVERRRQAHHAARSLQPVGLHKGDNCRQPRIMIDEKLQDDARLVATIEAKAWKGGIQALGEVDWVLRGEPWRR